MIKRKLSNTVGLTLASVILMGSNASALEGKITANSLNIRIGPSTKHNVITSVKKGSNVDIVDEKDGWCKVKLSNGKEGWASGQYIDKNLNTSSIDSNSSSINKEGVVTATLLNVRSGASTKNSKIGTLNKGTNVKVLSSSGEWYKIKMDNDKEGWVSKQYIKLASINTSKPNTNTTYILINKEGRVIANLLNIRSGPSTKDSKMGTLSKGTNVKVLSSNGEWYKIKMDNGKEGWVSKQYIEIGKHTDTISNTNKKITVEATAYTGYGITSTGDKPRWGTIAVDPKVIPYGTKVYIPYFNETFIANNTGGAIKGNKIDIYMDSTKECISWGRRNIEIIIID